MENDKLPQLYADLERCNMSVAEFSVMHILLQGPLPLASTAKFVKGEYRGDRLEKPLEEYVQAVDNCLKKNWIKALTEQEMKEREALLLHTPMPFVDDEIFGGVDEMDLTPASYKIFREAAK